MENLKKIVLLTALVVSANDVKPMFGRLQSFAIKSAQSLGRQTYALDFALKQKVSNAKQIAAGIKALPATCSLAARKAYKDAARAKYLLSEASEYQKMAHDLNREYASLVTDEDKKHCYGIWCEVSLTASKLLEEAYALNPNLVPVDQKPLDLSVVGSLLKAW